MTVKFDDNGFALTSGEITVYTADHNGIFRHKTTEYISEGGSLAVGSFLDAPPQAKAGFVVVRQENGWGYVADNRGTYYNTATGEQVEHTELGELPQNLTKIKPLDKPCKWNGSAWVKDEAKQAELKAQAQEAMRAKINAKRDEVDAGGVYIAPLGKWIDSNEKALQNILSVKASLDLLGDMPIPWTWADNSNSEITRTELTVIVGILLQTKQANHQNALMHKTAMMNVDNPQDYDYSTGWAETYADFLHAQTEVK